MKTKTRLVLSIRLEAWLRLGLTLGSGLKSHFKKILRRTVEIGGGVYGFVSVVVSDDHLLYLLVTEPWLLH
jgi:hypothetical protein